MISDPRLKFVKSTEKLDMTGNHNVVIETAIGKYVCLIGDDGTITADAIAISALAFDNNIEIIAPNVVVNYAWSDFRSKYFGMKHSSRLYVPKKVGNILHCNSFKRAFEQASINYLAAEADEVLPENIFFSQHSCGELTLRD